MGIGSSIASSSPWYLLEPRFRQLANRKGLPFLKPPFDVQAHLLITAFDREAYKEAEYIFLAWLRDVNVNECYRGD